jgi:hypothetical protein
VRRLSEDLEFVRTELEVRRESGATASMQQLLEYQSEMRQSEAKFRAEAEQRDVQHRDLVQFLEDTIKTLEGKLQGKVPEPCKLCAATNQQLLEATDSTARLEASLLCTKQDLALARTELQECRSQLAKLTADEPSEECLVLQAEMEQQQLKVAAANERIAQLEGQVDEQSGKLQMLQQQAEEATARECAAREQHEALAAEQLARITAVEEAATARECAAREQHEALAAEQLARIKAAEARVQFLQEQIEKPCAACAQLSLELSAARSEHGLMQEQLEELQEQCAEHSLLEQTQQAEVQRHQARSSSLESQLAALKAEKEQAQANSSLEPQLAELQTKSEQSEAALQEERAINSKLQAELADLTESRSSLQTQLSELQTRGAQMLQDERAKAVLLQSQLAELADKFSRLEQTGEQTLQEERETNVSLQGQLAELQTKIGELESAAAAASSASEILLQLQAKQQECHALSTQLSEQASQFAKASAESAASIGQLQDQCRKLELQIVQVILFFFF